MLRYVIACFLISLPTITVAQSAKPVEVTIRAIPFSELNPGARGISFHGFQVGQQPFPVQDALTAEGFELIGHYEGKPAYCGDMPGLTITNGVSIRVSEYKRYSRDYTDTLNVEFLGNAYSNGAKAFRLERRFVKGKTLDFQSEYSKYVSMYGNPTSHFKRTGLVQAYWKWQNGKLDDTGTGLKSSYKVSFSGKDGKIDFMTEELEDSSDRASGIRATADGRRICADIQAQYERANPSNQIRLE